MTAQQITERLQRSRSEWEPYCVGALFLFGSTARGEAREDSGKRVGLVTRAALKPRIRDRVLREAIRAA